MIDEWINNNYLYFEKTISNIFKTNADEYTGIIYEKLLTIPETTLIKLNNNSFKFYFVKVCLTTMYHLNDDMKHITDIDDEILTKIVSDDYMDDYEQNNINDNINEDLIVDYVKQNLNISELLINTTDDIKLLIKILDKLKIESITEYANYFKNNMNYFDYHLLILKENNSYREIQRETNIHYSTVFTLIKKCLIKTNKHIIKEYEHLLNN
jgi:hypothetical protein